MKKYLCLAFLLIPVVVFGQWVSNGNSYSTGSVLINGLFQSSSNYGLVLAPTTGDAIINRSTSGNLNISSGGGTSDIRLNYSYGGGSGGVSIFDGGATNHGKFMVNSSGNLNISSSGGYVGIGTSGPSQALDVSGRLKFRANGSGTSGVWFTGSDGTETLFFGQTGSSSADPLGIWHGGNWRFTLNQNGDVGIGIGTSAPQAKLDVNGTIKSKGDLTVYRNNNTDKAKIDFGAFSYLESRNQNGDSNSEYNYGTAVLRNAYVDNHTTNTYYNPNGYLHSQKIEMRAGNWYFDYRPSANGVVSSWSQSQWVNRLFIDGNTGNVAIGTTSPGSFKLAVEGKIGAREVNVTLASPWPDYVFSTDYKLPSLTELEQYIKTNKHLPEVPTAEQVKENGLSVGEMNAILLKKVEELTMYVIELKKENAEIIQLRKRIEMLEKK